MTAPAGCGAPIRATASGAISSMTATATRRWRIESEGTDLADQTIDQVLAIATGNGAHSVGGAYVDGINAHDQRLTTSAARRSRPGCPSAS